MAYSLLDQILVAMEYIRTSETAELSQDRLREWIESDQDTSLEITGAILHYLGYPEVVSRISPPLSSSHYADILLSYTAKCILHDLMGEWRDSRYEASWNFVTWFMSTWSDSGATRELPKRGKVLLASLYKAGDAEVRTCIVNAILEHLFTEKSVRRFFLDWKNDSLLVVAFEEACLWGNPLASENCA